MDRGSLALHAQKCAKHSGLIDINIIVAVAGLFVVKVDRFFECNLSKKAAIVAVYDGFQAL